MELDSQAGLSIVSQLPRRTAPAEAELVAQLMNWTDTECHAWPVKSNRPGNVVMLKIVSRNNTELFTGQIAV